MGVAMYHMQQSFFGSFFVLLCRGKKQACALAGMHLQTC